MADTTISSAVRDYLADASSGGKPIAANVIVIDGGKLAYSPKELAAATSFGKTVIFDEIRGGKLTARKAGRRTFIEADAAREWLRSFPTTREIVAA